MCGVIGNVYCARHRGRRRRCIAPQHWQNRGLATEIGPHEPRQVCSQCPVSLLLGEAMVALSGATKGIGTSRILELKPIVPGCARPATRRPDRIVERVVSTHHQYEALVALIAFAVARVI